MQQWYNSSKRSQSLLKPQCQWRYCQDLFCFTTGCFAHRGVAFKFSWNSIKLKVPSFQQRCNGSNGSGLATRPPSVPIWFVPQLSWIGYYHPPPWPSLDPLSLEAALYWTGLYCQADVKGRSHVLLLSKRGGWNTSGKDICDLKDSGK